MEPLCRTWLHLWVSRPIFSAGQVVLEQNKVKYYFVREQRVQVFFQTTVTRECVYVVIVLGMVCYPPATSHCGKRLTLPGGC